MDEQVYNEGLRQEEQVLDEIGWREGDDNVSGAVNDALNDESINMARNNSASVNDVPDDESSNLTRNNSASVNVANG